MLLTNSSNYFQVCSKQRSKNCKARVITGKNGRLEVSRNVYHNHGPDSNNSKITIKMQTEEN